MKLLFASHNLNKVKEIQTVLASHWEIRGLHDLDIKEEIPETGSTLVENALIKARYLSKKYQIACFADDTGLEVDCLNGAPGVYSARYAGEEKNAEANMRLLLENMVSCVDRSAQFKTVIAYIDDSGNEKIFEGIVTGTITSVKKGDQGFGYDPIFRPDGYHETFAEMSLTEKNLISHRSRAVKKLVDYLNKKEAN